LAGYQTRKTEALFFHRDVVVTEVLAMDLEDRLKQLQLLFGHALSASVAAKTNYLALAADLASAPATLARAKLGWQQLEAQKTAIIAQMVALEEQDQDDSFEPHKHQSTLQARAAGSTWRGYLKNWTERARPFASGENPWTATRNWWAPI
jgi:hypothetical protein